MRSMGLGNKIGRINANWITTGTLNPFRSGNYSQIFIDSENELNNSKGNVIVKLDSVTIFQFYVIINVPLKIICNLNNKNLNNSVNQHGEMCKFDFNGRRLSNYTNYKSKLVIINGKKAFLK